MSAGRFEVTISSDTDASSGVYGSRLDAMDAVDQAAAVDGLTARYGCPTAGCLVDDQGMAWFQFTIRPVP